MVVESVVHVFASHKGGTGKTQLCFQSACQYALDHPELHVMCFDLTELGDLTKRCLGGSQQDAGVVNDYVGGIFTLMDTAKKVDKQEQGGVSHKLTSLFSKKAEINFEEQAIKPFDFNDAIPENLWLISSGSATYDDAHRTPEETIVIANQIREALEKAPHKWKVFIDTDGDRRPAPFTKLGYALADCCIIPIQVDESDFGRLEPMFQALHEMYETGEMRCKIQLLCWNRLQLYRKEPSELGSFTTPKVTTDMMQFLNEKLWRLASERFPELFLHGKSPQKSFFVKSATVMVRDFSDSVAYPANACGIPFSRMPVGNFALPGSSTSFTVKQDAIDSCVENIRDLLVRLESMELES